MIGYINLFVEGNNQLAYKYFEKVIKQEKKIKHYFVKVYSYKFLSDKFIEENNTEKAIEYTKNALYSIPPKKHGDDRNLINDIIRPVLELEEGRDTAIEFLEYIIVENFKYKNKEAELYAYRTLEELYLTNGNYYQASEISIKVQELAKKLGKEYFRGKSLTSLARISYKQGFNEQALKILDTVKDIQAEDAEWHDKLNINRLSVLHQIVMDMKKYDEALNYAKEFDNYKANLTDEDRQDIDIIQNLMIATVYIAKDNLDLAKFYLDEASKILEIDKVVYRSDKDVYYYYIYGEMLEKKSDYYKSTQYYEKSKDLSVKRNNIELIIENLSNLEIVYSKLGKEELAKEYSLQLSKIKQDRDKKIYADFIKYINTQEESKEIKNKIDFLLTIILVLIFSIIVAFIYIYIVKLYPLIKLKKLRKKIYRNIYNNQYLNYYQPIINPKKSEIIGFEALLRLKEKDKILMPYVIIKEIVKANMMEEISIGILERIIKDYKQFKSNKNICSNFYVSMNMSLKEIESEEFIDKILNLINKEKVKRNSICIEITENINANNMNRVIINIKRLRSAGIIIAIDDFGVEYSNLSILDRIEYDIVKIDKIFIDNIHTSEVNKSIIEFCDIFFSKRNKSIVIEGVERIDQVRFIKNTKSQRFYIQGYFYSKPLALEDILTFKIINN